MPISPKTRAHSWSACWAAMIGRQGQRSSKDRRRQGDRLRRRPRHSRHPQLPRRLRAGRQIWRAGRARRFRVRRHVRRPGQGQRADHGALRPGRRHGLQRRRPDRRRRACRRVLRPANTRSASTSTSAAWRPATCSASMLKHADIAVYSLIKDVVEGKGVVTAGTLHLRPRLGRRRMLKSATTSRQRSPPTSRPRSRAQEGRLDGSISIAKAKSTSQSTMRVRRPLRPVADCFATEHVSVVPRSRNRDAPTTIAVELIGITKRFGAFVANDERRPRRPARRNPRHHRRERRRQDDADEHVVRPAAARRRRDLDRRRSVVVVADPAIAIAAGIGMVHQHFKLVPSLTVAENVFLGMEICRNGLIDHAAQDREDARAVPAVRPRRSTRPSASACSRSASSSASRSSRCWCAAPAPSSSTSRLPC